MQLLIKTLVALLLNFLEVNASASGSGTTTRYWDCCKPSCAWPGKANLAVGSEPVQMCDINNNPISDPNASSGCGGGTAYQCSNESPWAVDDNLAYGYAAVNIDGGSEASWCCACYELTFTSGPVAGKKMIVQATNTGGDLAGNQFDLSIPGGGVGIFNGCTNEWGAPAGGWGAQYGGISSRSSCNSFPVALKDGCYWRYDWFMGADNPTIDFQQVACPAALTNNTHCTRADDASGLATPAPVASGNATVPLSTSPIISSSTQTTNWEFYTEPGTSSTTTTSEYTEPSTSSLTTTSTSYMLTEPGISSTTSIFYNFTQYSTSNDLSEPTSSLVLVPTGSAFES